MSEAPKFTVSQFLDVCNQSLEMSLGGVVIEGEVSSFKINQGKWVFFDLKDKESSINCFMSVYQLRIPLEDGMKVLVRGIPKVTKWGKFSFTVQGIMPVGEGSIKKSFELLKAKLAKEGLFDSAKKRSMPAELSKIGVISSTAAAGYADFIKIINERWGGLQISVAHTQVQGMDAADQIIRALKYFNEHNEVQIIAIIRGGGSADDLAVFNDENLVRAVAASKIPVITGIGHEVDESLCDLAADLRGSTPSNVAQMLTKDRKAELNYVRGNVGRIQRAILDRIAFAKRENINQIQGISRQINSKIAHLLDQIQQKIRLIGALNPEKILQQGYAILSGKISPGNVVKITTFNQIIEAEIKNVKSK